MGAAPVVTISVTAPVTAGLLFDSAAISTTGAYDLHPANNSVSISTTVRAKANLAITKTGPANALAGERLVYTLSVANLGPSPMGLATNYYTNSGNIAILDAFQRIYTH